MIIIRTAEELACVLSSSLNPTLKERLMALRDQLLDYPNFSFEELCLFLIVQPGDGQDSINTAGPVRLVERGSFTFESEAVDLHGDWLEVLFILSDDGFGLVLFVPLSADTDPTLLSACKAQAPDLKWKVKR